jgi:general secretion pathway protein K
VDSDKSNPKTRKSTNPFAVLYDLNKIRYRNGVIDSISQSQRGVALITAVLITAVIAIAAVAMAAQQTLAVRRTANIIDGDRAYVFALGVETWAQQMLMRDKRDNQIDSLGEDWAQHLPPIAVEGAVVTGHIEDMQGLFNLNNLIDAKGKLSPLDMQRFQLLLSELNLDPNLADAVVDWIDPDSDVTQPGGAEDAEYMRAQTPYRAANRLFVSPSELLVVKGFTADIFQKLAPYVTALPVRTAINVNTAPKEVLMALASGITDSDAQELVDARGDKGFANLGDFLQQQALAGRGIKQDGLSVASDFFLLDAATQFGRGRTHLYSVMARNATGVVTISRGQGAF